MQNGKWKIDNTVDSLKRYYTAEAIKAFRYASKQEWNQLDDLQDIGSMQMRGRDFRQLAAAFLYNVTGDTEWENIFAQEPEIKSPQSQVSPVRSPAIMPSSIRTSSRVSTPRPRPIISPTWPVAPLAEVPTTAAGRSPRTYSS